MSIASNTARVALQVVKKPDFYEEEIEFHAPSTKGVVDAGGAHSLHYALPYAGSMSPEVPEYFLSKYSEASDVVLDPFCADGTTVLASNLLGRVAYGSDINPLSLAITEAKIFPSDLTEVTLGLQAIDLRAPININVYSEYFASFYEVNTFREIWNLKNYFSKNKDRIARFLRLISLSLMHGPSAGYFSVPTHVNHSLSPSNQDTLNIKHRQIPDYRAVLPRILKKTASVLRDGYPSIAETSAAKDKFAVTDARNLFHVPTSGVDLVVTAPPQPKSTVNIQNQWLQLWLLGESAVKVQDKVYEDKNIARWTDFMNESLLEMARAVRPGGRAVLEFSSEECAQIVQNLASEALGNYWSTECKLHAKTKKNCIKGSKKDTDKMYLVLRR